MTLLSPKRTLLSLTKKEILKLPGFENLGNYLLSELKTFICQRLIAYNISRRGVKIEDYMECYNKSPTNFRPTFKTKNKKYKYENDEERKEARKKQQKEYRERKKKGLVKPRKKK